MIMNQYFKLKNKKFTGFSLVELLVVIAIIGILSTVSIISLSTIRSKQADTKRLADIKKIGVALERYRAVNGHYPQCTVGTFCDYVDNSEWYTCLGEALKPLIGKIPIDPVRKVNIGYCYSTSAQSTGNKIVLQYHLDTYVSPNSVGADYFYPPAPGVFLYYVTIQPFVN